MQRSRCSQTRSSRKKLQVPVSTRWSMLQTVYFPPQSAGRLHSAWRTKASTPACLRKLELVIFRPAVSRCDKTVDGWRKSYSNNYCTLCNYYQNFGILNIFQWMYRLTSQTFLAIGGHTKEILRLQEWLAKSPSQLRFHKISHIWQSFSIDALLSENFRSLFPILLKIVWCSQVSTRIDLCVKRCWKDQHQGTRKELKTNATVEESWYCSAKIYMFSKTLWACAIQRFKNNFRLEMRLRFYTRHILTQGLSLHQTSQMS